MSNSQKFTFRKHASVGAAAAEDDERFLSDCFIDNGDLSPLLDCADRRRIILGRTGVGKSALIKQLADTKENVILVNPETLSFNYLTNSTILQFFLEIGVNLDLFFKLLWRHVFTVELLKARYDLRTQNATRSFFDRFKNMISKDHHKERAIQYLAKWGEHFWEETEYRIKEITQHVESELTASLAGKLPPADIKLGASTKLSEDERREIIQRGRTVINNIQMKELTDVLQYLNEDVFNDDKYDFYLCIDKLDENWVDEKFRYLLIRSLIETIRDFLQVRHVKIIVAIRTDLIERVFRFTRDSGFQEEKYRSLYLQVRWSENQLVDLLDRRISYLVRQTYTKKSVGFSDITPSNIGKIPTQVYMIQRTLLRPRDLIEFFNNCIEQADGRAALTKDLILLGEGSYSKLRLRSLQDEWVNDYPGLITFASILKQKPVSFRLRIVAKAAVEDVCLEYSIDHLERTDVLSTQARAVADGKASWEAFVCQLFHVFYLTGLVGLKTDAHEKWQWSYQGTSTIVADTINLDSSVIIHPMFFRVLGINPRGERGQTTPLPISVDGASTVDYI